MECAALGLTHYVEELWWIGSAKPVHPYEAAQTFYLTKHAEINSHVIRSIRVGGRLYEV
jgi:hypothetical protein